MAQYQTPGGPYVNDDSADQAQIPGGAFLNGVGGGPATTDAEIAATEAPDVAALSAISCFASIVAVEAPDVAAITTSVTTGASIAATESADVASLAAALVLVAHAGISPRPRLMLWETLPLRTTRMLGDYAEDVALPEGYGDFRTAPIPLIRLSSTRYFGLDHLWEPAEVFVDQQKTLAWEAVTAHDDVRTWTEIRFEAPIPEIAKVSAAGRGKRNPTTGELYENPADVLERIMQIAGRDDDYSSLRAECSRLDLRIAGRIAGTRSIADHIDEVMQSVGAIWTPGMARLYPSASAPDLILDLDKSEVEDLTVEATVADTADVVRVAYDRSDATGKPLHYIELTASPQLYGGVSKEVSYPWLRSPANAEAVGRPIAQRLAGERYDVGFDSRRRDLRPGMWIRLVAHPEWQLPGDDPVIIILRVEIDPSSDTIHVAGETILGDLPTITITAHSIALPATVEAGLDVSVRDGVATFTATDEDGRPLPGALVSLDGGDARTTDAQGKVSFPLKVSDEGRLHEVLFEAPGFAAITLIVPL